MNLGVISATTLRLLDGMVCNSLAKAGYDIMAGGLVWPDEFPPFGDPAGREVWRGYLPRFLVAYRASLTLGEARTELRELRELWDQVSRDAPHWPGLREDRRGEKARARLLAARRRDQICLDGLEHQLENPSE